VTIEVGTNAPFAFPNYNISSKKHIRSWSTLDPYEVINNGIYCPSNEKWAINNTDC